MCLLYNRQIQDESDTRYNFVIWWNDTDGVKTLIKLST